jgi:hypothetical protein
MAKEAQRDFRHDEEHDGDLEHDEPIVARHVEDQLERLLDAPQLVLEREVAVREVELGAIFSMKEMAWKVWEVDIRTIYCRSNTRQVVDACA